MYDLSRKLDVQATAAKLDELSADCFAEVDELREKLSDDCKFGSTLAWDLGVSIANQWLALEYKNLADAVRVSEGRESGSEPVEKPDPDIPGRTRSVRYLSPEEQVDWAMARALELVLHHARTPWSRSTGQSSNFVEDMQAGAAVEFLDTLGFPRHPRLGVVGRVRLMAHAARESTGEGGWVSTRTPASSSSS